MFRTPDAPATDVCKARSRVRPIVELTTPSGTPLKRKAQKHLRFTDDLFKTPEAKKDVKNKTERDDRTLAELQAQLVEKQKELQILEDQIYERRVETRGCCTPTPIKDCVETLADQLSEVKIKEHKKNVHTTNHSNSPDNHSTPNNHSTHNNNNNHHNTHNNNTHDHTTQQQQQQLSHSNGNSHGNAHSNSNSTTHSHTSDLSDTDAHDQADDDDDDDDDDHVISVYYDHNQANYTVLEKVGKGSYGTCHLVEHKRTGERLCRKRIDLCFKDIDMEDVRNETTFLQRIRHPNCLQLFDLHIDPLMQLSIYMEYCPWSLESLRLVRAPEGARRNRLAAPTVVNAVYQVLHGLDYLKHFGREEARARDAMGNSDQQLNSTLTIAHCDIKSDNLMINFEGLVKICDFGLGVLLEDNKHITDNMERGSEAYMAPEVAETKEYWEACDVYSLGVSAYEMLTGRLPKGRTKFGFWKKTKEMILKVTDDNSILTNQLLVLLKDMMETDPKKRKDPEALLKPKDFKVFKNIKMDTSRVEVLEALRKGERLHKEWLKWKEQKKLKGFETDLQYSDNDSTTDDSSSD